jgi:hypothetical protein
MSKEAPTSKTPADGTAAPEWWCNFCDFKTNDQKVYLSHSCAEVLKQQSKNVRATGKNACG